MSLPFSWPVMLAVIAVAALVILAVVIAIVRRSGRRSEFEDAGGEEAEAADGGEAEGAGVAVTAGSLGGSFRRAMRRLRRHVSGAAPRYQLPWYLVLGASGSRSPATFGRTSLSLPFGEPEEEAHEAPGGLRWWFFDHGILLDLAGEYVLAADGRSSDERGWRRFLSLLERHRPKRPLDGILLTLSAAELRTARARGGEGITALERRANLLYRKLWQSQQRLGFRAPVYVLVTGCEVLEGFGSFAAALPEPLRDGMLGWSNPYSAETAYHGSWVEEAFKALGERLGHLQLELYAGGREDSDADKVFVLPESVAALGDPLSACLDQVFKPSGYHESIQLRGIYFCGQEVGSAAAPAAPGGLPPVELPAPAPGFGRGGHTLFLKDLLAHKVFREAALAGPTATSLLARNRRVRSLQGGLAIAALVLGVGTGLAYWRLASAGERVKPFLIELERSVSAQAREGEEAQRLALRDRAGGLLAGLSRIDIRYFRSLFLPASWVSPFEEELEEAVVRGYDHIILEAMFLELSRQARSRTAPAPRGEDRFLAWEDGAAGSLDAAGGPRITVLPAERTPEMAALKAYVDALSELEEAAKTYNGLPLSRDLEDVAHLADLLFDLEVPEQFLEHGDLYRRTLGRVNLESFEAEDYHLPAGAKARELAQGLYRRLFEGNAFLAGLARLAEDLDQAARASWTTAADPQLFSGLVDRVEGVEVALSQPALEWIFRERFSLGGEFDETLLRMEGSAFLGPEVAAEIRRSGEARWLELRKGLTQLEAAPTGALLAVEQGQPQMRLSPDLLVLKAALKALLGQSFVGGPEGQPIRTSFPDDTRLSWDLNLLAQAATLSASYERFAEQTLPRFPADLQRAVDEVARRQLGDRMSALINRAQVLEPVPKDVAPQLRERQLKAEIDSFAAAVEPLNGLVQAFEDLSLWGQARGLGDLVLFQGGRLLAGVDELLTAEDPYRPQGGGFAWWKGGMPPSLPAFGARDPAELAVYLESERRRVAQLASSFAAPLITWLGEAGIHRQPAFRSLYLKWEGILLALKDYEAKKPGNAVTALETYIVEDMPQVQPGRCPQAETTTAALVGEVSNFFLARKNDLRRQLAGRCHVLAAERILASYPQLEEVFNSRLSGRYPFSAGRPGAFEAEADLADIEGYFRRLDPQVELIRSVCATEPEGYGGRCERLVSFLDGMETVRAFFAPYLDRPVPEAGLAFDLTVEFRVNRADPAAGPGAGDSASGNPERELGGDRIIDWRLAVGDRAVDLRSPGRTLTWLPGLPVRLELRWAQDSPRVPVAGQPWPQVEADGRTAFYEFNNLWSLLSFLQCCPSDDPRRHTLKLEIETAANPGLAAERRKGAEEAGGRAAAEEEPTRVFLRLSLAAPAAKAGEPATAVALPPTFPARAPHLVLGDGEEGAVASPRTLGSRRRGGGGGP